MTKTRNTVMIRETNETEKGKGTKKGKKTKTDNSKQLELPNSITCHGCQQIFTKQDAKILCCDRCDIWYCTKCAQISDAGYKFLSSVEAEDIAWFCKSCVQPAKVALLEDKSIEDKVKEHVEKLNQRIKTIESNLPKKVETTEFEKLQKKVEELEGEIKKKYKTKAKKVDHGQI